jgi:hypothetical protein
MEVWMRLDTPAEICRQSLQQQNQRRSRLELIHNQDVPTASLLLKTPIFPANKPCRPTFKSFPPSLIEKGEG